MAQIQLPFSPREASKTILKKLASRRMQDVIKRRFGLAGGKVATLESIGREYKITRERVRQIEADALKLLRKEENLAELQPLFGVLEARLASFGNVAAHHRFLAECADKAHHRDLVLLLTLNKIFQKIPETDVHHERWSLDRSVAADVEKVLAGVSADLGKSGVTVPEKKLYEIAAKNAADVMGHEPEQRVLEAYLATSKMIQKNPYGEYGLVSWPTVSPTGVKDKAYAALMKSNQPLHFRQVASAIDAAGWSKRKAHPQTVHNELIKDKRFVLVGRGLYGLASWGFEPGAVREVLVSVFKAAKKPLSKDQAVKLVLEKRAVKPQTILLNLQNKSLFRKTENEEYTLV
ncbi:MAG: hypothetical protein HY617_03150 [Candidatus Sungbacteria bacterium]|nr:hypothetical protein [Candidatus Sungbacteria bacterium]